MGWRNSGGPEDGETSGEDTSSDRSASGGGADVVDKRAMAALERRCAEALQSKDAQLKQSQHRAEAVERRIRERDAQLSALKEDKAGCLRQIGDLKNQLYQLVRRAACVRMSCALWALGCKRHKQK